MKPARLNVTLTASCLFSGLALACLAFTFVLVVYQSLPVWKSAGVHYLTGKEWFFRDHLFGSLPMLYGTLVVAGVALLLAAPVGIATGIFVAELAPPSLRQFLKVTIELLAGIPSVVYGLLGVLFLRNWVYDAFSPLDPLSGDTLLTAGLLLAVMILPTIMTLTDDALRAVPAEQRAAARGLGLTRTETICCVTLPGAVSGIFAAVLLALGRALGETIAVFLVVGRQDNQWPGTLFSLRPLLESGQTLTSKLGGSETNIAYGDPLHWAAIVGLGLILLAVTLLSTLAGVRLNRRKHA